jgi:large subunit ribosomal protein L29
MAKNIENFSSLSVEDLNKRVDELKGDLSKLKFDHAVKGVANPMVIRSSRKEVARALTELRAREVADMPAEQLAKRDRLRLRRK